MELTIAFATEKPSMAEIRPHLDAALHESFPGGMLARHWDGEVLHLSGPGAKGTVVLESGQLIGRAWLAPPASFMRKLIEEKVSAALQRAAG